MALFRKRTEKTPPAFASIGEQEVVPGALWVTVSHHQLEFLSMPVTCWRYRTRGLAKVGQREITLWLQCAASEDPEQPPIDPLAFFRLLQPLAAEGRTVGRYDCTLFGAGSASSLLGAAGVLYAPAWSPVSGRDEDLIAILLPAGEAEVAYRVNPTRVLARLGESGRYYPFPFWNVRGRPQVAQPDEKTVLANSPAMHIAGATIVQKGGQVTISLPRSSRAAVSEQLTHLPPDMIGLRTAFSRDAGAHLVWRPGQPQATAISAAGADRSVTIGDPSIGIAGSFALIVGGQATDSQKVAEDGFAVLLTPAAFTAVHNAMQSGSDATINAAGPGLTSFSVAWV